LIAPAYVQCRVAGVVAVDAEVLAHPGVAQVREALVVELQNVAEADCALRPTRPMYNVHMPRYSTAQARQHLAELLNAAEAGEPVVIERRGTRFVLRADSPKARHRSPARRVRIEVVDPAVRDGRWTWAWDRRGLRFSARRSPR
jgi:antitoxin (DNA-binding transcriptional repressor) of toxin-antitoxin stability system